MNRSEIRRAVVSLDGCGVVADEPLVFGEGVRLRVHLTTNPAEDVTVYVEGGALHVLGQYRPVQVVRVTRNVVHLYAGEVGQR